MANQAKKSAQPARARAAPQPGAKLQAARPLTTKQLETAFCKLQSYLEDLTEDLETCIAEEDQEKLSELLYDLAAHGETFEDEAGALSDQIRRGLGLKPLDVDDG